MAKMMRKSMKAMKMSKRMAMKSKKMMARKMAMKKSKVGKRRSVFSGTKVKTSGGMVKSDLKKNKNGKIVSRKASDRAKKSKNGRKIVAWGAATKSARKALGIKGFCPVGGSSARGKALLAKVRSIYKK